MKEKLIPNFNRTRENGRLIWCWKYYAKYLMGNKRRKKTGFWAGLRWCRHCCCRISLIVILSLMFIFTFAWKKNSKIVAMCFFSPEKHKTSLFRSVLIILCCFAMRPSIATFILSFRLTDHDRSVAGRWENVTKCWRNLVKRKSDYTWSKFREIKFQFFFVNHFFWESFFLQLPVKIIFFSWLNI